MKRLKELLLILSLCTLIAIPVVATTGSVSALSFRPTGIVAADSAGDACNGLQQLGDTNCPQNGGKPESKIGNLTSNIVNIISYIAGAIAVIMIIISGIRYITSGGEANGVSAAKTTLIYALIGVVVVALAQLLVHLVLSQTNI